MTRIPRFFWLLAVLWALFWAGSFLVFSLTEPTGDGFTRGLDRLGRFAGLQAAAGAVAVVLWLAGRRAFARGTALRWLSRVPLLLAALLLGFVMVVIAWAMLQPRPAPEPQPGPATVIPRAE